MSSEITQILHAVSRGDAKAAAELLPVVYAELRRLATQKMAQERPGQTLQATALVHEAYLRLVGDAAGDNWSGRGHFFAAAAEAMRRILVEGARRKKRIRHGGKVERVQLRDIPEAESADEILALDEALEMLTKEDALAARVVELRHYAGLGHEEIAAALGITIYKARQKWTYARAWLKEAIEKG